MMRFSLLQYTLILWSVDEAEIQVHGCRNNTKMTKAYRYTVIPVPETCPMNVTAVPESYTFLTPQPAAPAITAPFTLVLMM